MEVNDNKEKNKVSGLLFTGLLFTGMAVGFFFHNIPAGVFAGLAAGFLASAFYRMRK
jgi:hypothetical protein